MTSLPETLADDAPPGPYATLTPRLRAIVTDVLVQGLAFVVLLILGEFLPSTLLVGRLLLAGVLTIVILYEPVLVTTMGGTIGHQRANLRVVTDATGRNPGFLRASARFLLKSLLGVVSFLAMAFTLRRQAVHDSLTGTTVQVRDLVRARPGEFAAEREFDPRVVLPSAARRIMSILASLLVSLVGWFVAIGIIAAYACPGGTSCSAGADIAVEAITLLWMCAVVVLVIAGWHGRLPGARRRLIDDSVG